jgi:hypothetical protein
MRIVLPWILMLYAATATAADGDAVYRYTDSKGIVHYTDKPPEKNAKPVNLPKLQTIPARDVTKGLDPAKGKTETTKFSLSFDSPTPEQTFREVGATVPVSVSVMPGLIGGYGLMYTVDGKPINDAPSFSTSIAIPGLERGSHVISVALVDAKRKPQATATVTVHMKPPMVRR